MLAGDEVLGWVKFGAVVVATVPIEDGEFPLDGEAVIPVIP